MGTHLNCIDKSMQFQMGTHNMCLYKEIDKKYTSCNLKTIEFLDCALIGVCAVIRSNVGCRKGEFSIGHYCDLKWNGYTYKGNNSSFVPILKRGPLQKERICFSSSLLEETPYLKGLVVQESKQEVTEVISTVKNNGKPTKYTQSP